MKRKALFIFFTAACILFIATTCFATNDTANDIKNGISGVTDTLVDGAENLGNDVKNGIGTAAGAIENGARDVGNTLSNGMENIGNTINAGVNDVSNGFDNNNYTATRTTAYDITDTDIMNSNIWTWVALAVAGIVIVGLVWYYAKEHEGR